MKTKLLITLSILSLSLFSQNWSLINLNYTYNYAVNNVYELSIYADSVSVNGNDTMFFINKIVITCDTCSDNYGALLRNQPTFFQKEVTRKFDKYVFSDSLNFAILSQAETNDTWIFDTLNNINAEVVSKTYESFFGINDSIKYIKLSNNDSIILSKKYGIIRFDVADTSSYQLIGIEKPTGNIGYTVPKFQDFFNFNVGDVFQYRRLDCSGATGVSDYIRLTKKTILSKEINEDTITYIIQKDYASSYTIMCQPTFWVGDGNYYNYTTDTLVFIDSLSHFTNLYNYELYSDIFPSGYFSSNDSIYYETVKVSVENGLTTKEYRAIWPEQGTYFFYNPNNPDILLMSGEIINKAYTTGLGMTYLQKEWFEGGFTEELIGFVKNGDTTGIVYGEDIFQSIKQIEEIKSDFSIYPNPANEYTTVEINDTESKLISEICIYNISGKIVKRISANKKVVKINTKMLKNGVYFVNLKTKNGISQRKKLIIL